MKHSERLIIDSEKLHNVFPLTQDNTIILNRGEAMALFAAWAETRTKTSFEEKMRARRRALIDAADSVKFEKDPHNLDTLITQYHETYQAEDKLDSILTSPQRADHPGRVSLEEDVV